MKILYILDIRYEYFNEQEKCYLFKYWSYSFQDLLNNKTARTLKLWLVCINVDNYIDILNFSDDFSYENINTANEKVLYYFEINKKDVESKKKIENCKQDPLLFFLRDSEHILKIKECDKIIVLSCNIHLWIDKIPELIIIGDLFYNFFCDFHFFNIEKKVNISTIKEIEQISFYLEKYSNFYFKNIELNKINILQIIKEILSIKFIVTLTLGIRNEGYLLKCEAIPLISELSKCAYIGLKKVSIKFDIRGKALKDGIAQHLIYGIPLFLSNKSIFKNDISLFSVSKELYEKNHVLILRSNINPLNLEIHEEDVQFLWVGLPMLKKNNPVAICLHGLSTQETYSLEIEENSKFEQINENNSNIKLEEFYNLTLIKFFNPLEYSNKRLKYSLKNSKNSKMDLCKKNKKH